MVPLFECCANKYKPTFHTSSIEEREGEGEEEGAGHAQSGFSPPTAPKCHIPGAASVYHPIGGPYFSFDRCVGLGLGRVTDAIT